MEHVKYIHESISIRIVVYFKIFLVEAQLLFSNVLLRKCLNVILSSIYYIQEGAC